MLKMNTKMADVATRYVASATTGCSFALYSATTTRDALNIPGETNPTEGKLIEYPNVGLGYSQSGFVKIANLSAAAQAAVGTADGEAVYFRLYAGAAGVFVGLIGDGHALKLVGGNTVTTGQPKTIQSFAFKFQN